jgi:hypothetical protein
VSTTSSTELRSARLPGSRLNVAFRPAYAGSPDQDLSFFDPVASLLRIKGVCTRHRW